MSHPDDNPEDAHIDVCLGCGRYYGTTKSLIDKWYELYKPNKEVMPQLCYKCLVGNAPHG